MSLTSGLHWPRSSSFNHSWYFDDFVVISVICFAQDSLESSFTPRYAWLATLESGCPNSEYWCELGLVLFVMGRCTHFDILNCFCHLSDHFSSWIKSVCRIWWSMLEFILRYIMLSSANRRILDWMFSLMSLMYSKKSTGPRSEPCGTPDVTSVVSDRAPLTETRYLPNMKLV